MTIHCGPVVVVIFGVLMALLGYRTGKERSKIDEEEIATINEELEKYRKGIAWRVNGVYVD